MENKTHISPDLAKKLKKFLGDSAPEPIDPEYACGYSEGEYMCPWPHDIALFPAYQLHDLLSKEFCEVMADITDKAASEINRKRCAREIIRNEIVIAYYNGGLSAVEKELLRMMEGK